MTTMSESARDAVVLLAEDNAAEQNLARRAFSKSGVHCDMRIVSDGEEALDYLFRRGRYEDPATSPRPDLILLDLNMPKLDGREVLRQVKSHPKLGVIPLVVLTTSRSEQDMTASYKLGCNSYITKPVDIHDFVDVVARTGSYWLKLVTLHLHNGD